MAILNSNSYRTGYEAGIAAAESGKEKDYRSVAKSWKTWVWGSPGMNTFIQGYDEGYEKGLAKVHGVYTTEERGMQGTSSGTSGGTSGGMHALADSAAIEGLITELQRFGQVLREDTGELQAFVQGLGGRYWDDANYQEFLGRFARLVGRVAEIESDLIERDMVATLRDHAERVKRVRAE